MTGKPTDQFHCAALVCGRAVLLFLLLGLVSGCATKKTAMVESPSDLTKLPMEILMTIPVRNKPSPEVSRASMSLAKARNDDLRFSAGCSFSGKGAWQC